MQKLRLKSIRIDGGTQMRVGPRNQEAVREYADVLKDGGQLPPVTVFYDGRDYWLSDGFHRLSAHMLLDWQEIDAEVREGSKRDAILYAVGANASHGLRRSNQDKRRAVETLLKDEEWGQNSDNWIAKQAHVSQPFVSKLRHELAPSLKTVISERRTSDGRTMQTANIGQRPALTAAPAQPERQPVVDTPPIQGQLSERDTEVASLISDQGNQRAQQEVLSPEPPLINQIAEPGEKVIKAEDLYIPFDDSGAPPKTAAEIEKGVKDIHSALDRLMRHERDGRSLLAAPDPYTRSVRSLARMAQEMLEEWLDSTSEKESRTLTIDAMN